MVADSTQGGLEALADENGAFVREGATGQEGFGGAQACIGLCTM